MKKNMVVDSDFQSLFLCKLTLGRISMQVMDYHVEAVV